MLSDARGECLGMTAIFRENMLNLEKSG